ncbi:MAG TPA: HAMP domain-containing sensor histidine kinase [Micropepsaceae bacterium]|nr:HAMP domain-containing sensor histidine kinase [Micropepsaceae bacterium]
MVYARTTGDRTLDDPRILKVQVERAAKAIHGTIVGSPLWVCFFALMCSDPMPFLGKVPVLNALALVLIITLAAGIATLVLRAFSGARESAADCVASRRWLSRLLWVSAVLSMAWGCAPWLLWDEVNATNHVFIELMCLAIVGRFLVNRSNHIPFFLASYVPMASMLFLRCVISLQATDLVLAALVPLYAIQLFLDAIHISERWDDEALMRFSHEDLSRELEETRDEALMKRAEAETANASKTAFLANMSHELRTPLNAILGFSEIIARECLGPVGSPRYKEYAGDIHSSGAHLLSLINDLLDVAKIEAGRMEIEPQIIETERALNGALKFVGSKARDRRQALTIEVDEHAAILYADERALKQIVINLVSNAVKFTHDGGCIDVAAKRNNAGDFELVVADNGPGIPKEKLGRIFKPFSRVDNRYDSENTGTGLGLALVRGLAELHGGRAWMESEEGKGTRVHVVLPMTAAAQERTKRRVSA